MKYAVEGDVDGSVAIKRKPTKKYSVYYELVPLEKVARKTKNMPSKFMNREGNDVTKAFLDYARPLVGKLPEIGRLKGFPVPKIK